MSRKLKLSVVVPTYNRCAVLEDAIRSISNSKSPDIEILIIDNASSDDTEIIVRKYQSQDERIRYIKNRINVGASRALYLAFLQVRGDAFAILGDRDHPTQGYFEEVINVFETNTSVGVFHSAYVKDISKKPTELCRMSSMSGLIPKGNQAVPFMYTASGMIHGLAFRTKAVSNKFWLLDNRLYPQILLAGMVGINWDAYYYVSDTEFLHVPPTIGKLSEVKKYQNRPADWGILERLEIAQELIREHNKVHSDIQIEDLIDPLLQFAAEVFFEMCREDLQMAKEYITAITDQDMIMKSTLFWGVIMSNLSMVDDKTKQLDIARILNSLEEVKKN